MNPAEFTDCILGVTVMWLEDQEFQVFCIQFLQQLRVLQLDKLMVIRIVLTPWKFQGNSLRVEAR